MEQRRKRFLNAATVLPQQLYSVLSKAPDSISTTTQEIILRSERPLCVQCGSKRYYFTDSGCITDTLLDTNMIVVSKRSLFDTFMNICNYSVYSRQQEINNGFVTLKGGHRAGICGTAVLSGSNITNIKDITSINIRIAREIIGCSDKLCEKVSANEGLLICGAPSSGKTTLIRDYARTLSYTHKVSVIDERGELASTVNGVFQNDIAMCDVFDSYQKADAITHAVRCMSPDIIVCDEISTLCDLQAVTYGVNSGVSFVATVHADSVESLLSRKIAVDLLKTKAFSKLVFLDSRHNAGAIKSVINISEVLGDIDA